VLPEERPDNGPSELEGQMGARAYGLFARVLYGLSTANEQIELGYLLNGSNNGHNPYLARGPWEKASPWITEGSCYDNQRL
jgi:hypothetical protein